MERKAGNETHTLRGRERVRGPRLDEALALRGWDEERGKGLGKRLTLHCDVAEVHCDTELVML
jgi:hypothetical protein